MNPSPILSNIATKKDTFSRNLCLICQKNKNRESLVKTPKSLIALFERIKKLSNFGEPKYIPVFENLKIYSAVINMSSFDIDASRVRAAIQTDQELNIRYDAAFDARARGLKYHRYCIKSQVYTPLSLEIDNSLQIKTMLDTGFFSLY